MVKKSPKERPVKPQIIVANKTNQPSSYSNFQMTVDGKTHSFSLSPSITGCGLCLLQGIAYSPIGIPLLDGPVTPLVKKILKDECTRSAYYKIIATLGDTYVKAYEPSLLKFGFKKIDEFLNKNHGTGYKQHIYSINVSDIEED